MRRLPSLLSLAFCLVICAAPGTAAEPSYEDLNAGVTSYRDVPGLEFDHLRISGTVTAGRQDLIGKNEYLLNLLGSEEAEVSKGEVKGIIVAALDLTKRGGGMKPGDKRTFTADLPLKWVKYWNHKYVALSWMEKDIGLGIGSVDTPILFMLGGAPDKVACTEWIPIQSIYDAPMTVDLGPTLTGARLSVILQIIPAKGN